MSGRAAGKRKIEGKAGEPEHEPVDAEQKEDKEVKKRTKNSQEVKGKQAASEGKTSTETTSTERSGPRKWLLKSEPDEYSIDLLRSHPNSTGFWDVSPTTTIKTLCQKPRLAAQAVSHPHKHTYTHT
jgi:hypothetical protein